MKNNMDNKSYDQLLIMPDTIESNMKEYDEKMKNLTEEFTKSSLGNKDSTKAKNSTTVVQAKKKGTSL